LLLAAARSLARARPAIASAGAGAGRNRQGHLNRVAAARRSIVAVMAGLAIGIADAAPMGFKGSFMAMGDLGPN